MPRAANQGDGDEERGGAEGARAAAARPAHPAVRPAAVAVRGDHHQTEAAPRR